MKEQMARLRKLIDDILDLSRLERDRDQGGRSPVDINSIAEHVAATQFVAAEAAGLTLTCEVADNVQPVVARPDQLTRAITNVVSNAIKYTPLGTVRVQTRSQDQRVCIEVTDTGLGIPADELPHLFGRFYRGRQVAQSSIPGTGLGLSIVKEIVESHGGTVEVESELGVGSVFRIWLPTLA
jgi:signal transduction histidine kinase